MYIQFQCGGVVLPMKANVSRKGETRNSHLRIYCTKDELDLIQLKICSSWIVSQIWSPPYTCNDTNLECTHFAKVFKRQHPKLKLNYIRVTNKISALRFGNDEGRLCMSHTNIVTTHNRRQIIIGLLQI